MVRSSVVARTLAVVCLVCFGVGAHAEEWNKEAWLKKLEAAKKAEGNQLIQYDAQPNYANWGGITAAFQRAYGVRVPPDMKSSSATMAALLKEQDSTVADTAYYNALIGTLAAEKGLHASYKPMNWEKIPDYCKDPNGTWVCLHEGVIAFVVNTDTLKKANVPVPQCWKDLLDPKYKGLIAYDDPTVQGTALDAVVAATLANGGSPTNLKPGMDYLKKLDANIFRYSRDTSYNPTLRGEIGIWLHADGSGYKMKWDDQGPIEVVIPCEGTVTVPLNIGLVKWAKRPLLAKAYLDWLLSPEAQGLWADSYWRPIIPEYITENAKKRMTPLHGTYDSIVKIEILTKRNMVDPLKQAWLENVKRQ